MTTTRIEEMVQQTLMMTVDGQRVYDTLNQEQKDCFHTNIRKALNEAVPKAHQAGIDEAVEILEKGHICGTSCIYQCDYIDAIKAIKALQDNK